MYNEQRLSAGFHVYREAISEHGGSKAGRVDYSKWKDCERARLTSAKGAVVMLSFHAAARMGRHDAELLCSVATSTTAPDSALHGRAYAVAIDLQAGGAQRSRRRVECCAAGAAPWIGCVVAASGPMPTHNSQGAASRSGKAFQQPFPAPGPQDPLLNLRC